MTGAARGRRRPRLPTSSPSSSDYFPLLKQGSSSAAFDRSRSAGRHTGDSGVPPFSLVRNNQDHELYLRGRKAKLEIDYEDVLGRGGQGIVFRGTMFVGNSTTGSGEEPPAISLKVN